MQQSNQAATDSRNHSATRIPRLYVRRYFIILSIFLLNLTNSMIWNSFASVASKVVSYFDVTFDDVNMLSIVFSIITVPVGFFAMWSIDSFDIQKSVIGAGMLNAGGGILRFVSALPGIESSARYPILLTGQCISAVSQAFIMFLPPKLAQCWFPENQRALANTLGTLANPLGILIAAIVSPVMLQSTSMLNLLIMYAAAAVFAMIVTGASFTKSKPPTPPSASAEHELLPFKIGFRNAFRNKMFLVLTFCFSIAMGIFTLLIAMMAQITCPFGYGDTYAGVAVVLMIGFGFVGSIISGVVVDKTKLFDEIMKIFAGVAVLFLSIFLIVAAQPYTPYWLGIVLSIFGFFGFGLYAVSLELAVETTFPVPEATSTGIMVIFGQVFSAVFILVFQELGVNTIDNYGTCSADATAGSAVMNFVYGNMFVAAFGCVAFVTLVTFYRCPYNRLKFERKARPLSTTELTSLSRGNVNNPHA